MLSLYLFPKLSALRAMIRLAAHDLPVILDSLDDEP